MKQLVIVMTAVACSWNTARCSDPVDRTAEEAAIREAVAAYVIAFNAGDGKALAALWLPEAVYVAPDNDQQVIGREAIEAMFAQKFAEEAGAKLEAKTDSIQFISPNVAVESGTAKVTIGDQPGEETEYTAVYVKQGGKWLLDRVTEEEVPVVQSNHEHLKDLEWMIGTWVDQDEFSRVETSCQWTKNRNFMVRWFTITVRDRLDTAGLQIVGWDPAAQKIRSWVFDSDGSFGDGIWNRKNDTWYIQATGIESDGRKSSAVNIIKYLDQDTMTWQSVNRVVDGEILPNVDETIIVRQPAAE